LAKPPILPVLALAAGLALQARQAGAAESCIVFLVPGAFGQGTSSFFLAQKDYFADYPAFFRSKGCETRAVEFPQDATIEIRAVMIRDQVDNHRKGFAHTYLLAHSQGGLDARYALRSRGLAGVEALASLGVPHEGTLLADWAVSQRDRGTPIYWLLRLFGYDLRQVSFLGEMRPEFLRKHAARFEAVPQVRYGSGRAVCRTHCHWGLSRLARWVGIGPGDGLVSGTNQGFGEELGEYDLDHISEVGADRLKAPERQRFLERAWVFFSGKTK
jgi:hypothetical protein